jgi:hypothetical protein
VTPAIEELFVEFRDRLVALVKNELILDVLKGVGAPQPARTKRQHAQAQRQPLQRKATHKAAPGPAGRVKRTTRLVGDLADRIATVVRKHPGVNRDGLAHHLGAPRDLLKLPIAKALKAGKIRVTGKTRAAAYWPA